MVVAVALLVLLAWMWRRSPRSTVGSTAVAAPPPPAASSSYSDAQLTAAVDLLLASSQPSVAANQELPQFALEQLAWLFGEMRSGRLRIILLSDLSNTNLTSGDLMASGTVDGIKTVIVARPRFLELLAEGPGPVGPFTEEQRNDFMLGLVHEAVHLRGAPTRSPEAAGHEAAMAEEVRVWREVNQNVVRPLRAAGRPVHRTFTRIDDQFRACGDRIDCRPPSIVTP